jgi:hypothetical protein
MSYENWKRGSWQQWDMDGDEESPAQPLRSPGKRTLTMSLPPRSVSPLASMQAPVQQKADPAAVMQRKEQAALTEQWMDVALRPDLHDAPVQRKSMGEERNDGSLSLPASGGQSMPEEVQSKMERAFSTDFSAVHIHEGPQATAMGALAYTQGTDIHFAPGQYNPNSQRGQALLGHELTHVVQQSQGRVQATTQAKGVDMNNEAGLEREAEEMGAKVARGERVIGGGDLVGTERPGLAADLSAPIQRAVVLTEAQIEAAQTHNNFVLGDVAARNEILAHVGGVEGGTFDQAAVQALANYQEANAITRQDGCLDRDTLDFIIRAMVDARDYAGVITVITDFFNLNDLQTAVELQHDGGVTGDPVGCTTDSGTTIWSLGDDSFTNGLDGLGVALNTAIGAGTSLNTEALDVLLADSATDRRTAMWSNPDQSNEDGLVPWIRENFPTEADLAAFLSRTDITSEEKTAAFGRFSVELGRLEYLMGVIYHGGNDQTWENLNTQNTNRGTFVNHFKDAVGNGVNQQPWCTMFAGYLKTLLGFEDSLADGGPLIFNAGIRLDHWATAGVNYLTAVDDFSDPSDFADYSGASIDTPDWVVLRRSVTGSNLTQAQREEAITTFFSTRITPQPGDILIINTGVTNNTYSGSSSHTTTVESYNDFMISTIEGNRGQKLTGVELDLRDSNDAGQILCLVRIGIEFYTENDAETQDADRAGEEPVDDQAAAPVEAIIQEEDIINPLKQMVRNLQLIADQKGYINDSATGATVANMAGNAAAGGTQ